MTNIYHETLSQPERKVMINLLEKVIKFDDSILHDKFRKAKVFTPEYDIILQDISNIVKRKKEMKEFIKMLKD